VLAGGPTPSFPSGAVLLRDRYDSLSKIERIACPILFIHGGSDSLVPPGLGRVLFRIGRAGPEGMVPR